MKSMWGRLSSNATAALSAVQEAYISTGKEGPAESPKEAELSGRTLSAWPDAAEGSSSSSGTTLPGTASWSPSTAAAMAPLTASGNPWATTKPVSPQIPSIFDNPWRTDAESAPRLLDAPITSRMSRSLSSPTPPKSLPAASSPWARESVADVELPGGPLSHSSTTPSATSPLQSLDSLSAAMPPISRASPSPSPPDPPANAAEPGPTKEPKEPWDKNIDPLGVGLG